MAELVSISEFTAEQKIEIVKTLDFDTDGIFVLNKDKTPVFDPYTHDRIRIENMLIMPGSTIFLDNNLLSIFSYMQDHPDVI